MRVLLILFALLVAGCTRAPRKYELGEVVQIKGSQQQGVVRSYEVQYVFVDYWTGSEFATKAFYVYELEKLKGGKINHEVR